MKKILILCGHPAQSSYSDALVDAYTRGALEKAADVRVHKLADMTFDTDFGQSRFRDAKPLEPDLQAFWQDLQWADHFVLLHPLWWGGMPAKLKGLIDRVFLPGNTFRYVKGKSLPEGLLKGKTAEVFVTADTPPLFLSLVYGNGIRKQTERQILKFCGMKMKGYHVIGTMHGASDAKRAGWLKKAATRGRKAAA
ncbi:MAG: NAD(P)H-dependent oxidoreductase [Rhodobacteraceae bacterium]|nr:NAD(P)H-dependent oxidoreductase [Paracoccaceae bacterium]